MQALGLDGGVVEVVGFQILVADDAGADEAAFKIAVDLAGSLRGLGALADGPGAALLLAVGSPPSPVSTTTLFPGRAAAAPMPAGSP